MFQYAAGRALSLRLGVDLLLDISWFSNMEGCTPRAYQLCCFPVKAKLASRKTLAAFYPDKQNFLQKIANKFTTRLLQPQVSIFREPHFQYTPEFERISAPVYISGYWQSEKYFCKFPQSILSDFTFPPLPLNLASNIKNKILSTENSVFIHIRRGDYVKDKTTAKVHGICPKEYYANALRKILNSVNNSVLFIFGDDLDWIQQNFDTQGCPHTIVNLKTLDQPWHDMHLMTLCKHHIIANSSFSWWGAWLAKQPGITIAPKHWFNALEKRLDNPSPNSWICI